MTAILGPASPWSHNPFGCTVTPYTIHTSSCRHKLPVTPAKRALSEREPQSGTGGPWQARAPGVAKCPCGLRPRDRRRGRAPGTSMGPGSRSLRSLGRDDSLKVGRHRCVNPGGLRGGSTRSSGLSSVPAVTIHTATPASAQVVLVVPLPLAYNSAQQREAFRCRLSPARPAAPPYSPGC
jgi:hypothetical protein